MRYYFFVILILLFACKQNKDATTQQIKDSSNNASTNTITEPPSDIEELELTNEQLKNTSVKIGKASIQNIYKNLKATGIIDVPPTNLVSISCPLGGYLKFTNMVTGRSVKKGDIIAVLEDPQYIQIQQDYLIADIKLKQFVKEYNRQLALNNIQANSTKNLEQIKSDLDIQKTIVNALSEKLKYINIDPTTLNADKISRSVNLISPINGFVSKVYVNIGKYSPPAEVLFDIVNPTKFHLHFQIYEQDLESIEVGQTFEAYSPTIPDKKMMGSIVLVNKDVIDKTIRVHGELNTNNKQLLPGMFMIANIKTKAVNAITIPEDAIVNFENNQYIFIALTANKFQLTKVEMINQNNFNGLIQIKPLENVDILKQNIVISDAFSLLTKLKNKEED